ncbi:hypothetical protein E4T48_01632 [Aureobasidium sp. EXF-10727]|nr:hypothetical protein E4T48_01632 [Aureobasidium sp. EXF-10727]
MIVVISSWTVDAGLESICYINLPPWNHAIFCQTTNTAPPDKMLPLPTILDLDIANASTSLLGLVNPPLTCVHLRPLRQQCSIFGIVTGRRHKEVLLTMIGKFPTQPVIYEGFEHRDLVDFANSRHLKLSKTAQRHLDKCTIKRAETAQILDANKAASQLHHSNFGSHTALTESGVLLRRSSRLAAQPRPATSTLVSKGPPKISGTIAMPVRGPAARKVVHKSQRAIQRMLQKSLKAAERRSRTSLIQELERADLELQFDFLGLPAEVRDMVLHLVCISSTAIVHPQQQPAIAKTCHLLRREALALYYGSNRFTVFVTHAKLGVQALSDINNWLRDLEPCCLASVRSISFVNFTARIILDVDFDIRGQRFGLVRRSAYSPPQYRIVYTLNDYERQVRNFMNRVRWGEKLHRFFPRTVSSSSMLMAFKSLILKRIEQASGLTTIDDRSMTWRRSWELLGEQWIARKGFSWPSIMGIAEMLTELDWDANSLWFADFEH